MADWQHAGFGVYVHWPFCLAKCPYCDFNSHVSRQVDHDAWAKALSAEARHMRGLTGPRSVNTVFFGGGTPSLMPPSLVAGLIDQIDAAWGLAADAETTLEANPTSVEAAKFRDYAAAGVNRVSMGVQALNDRDLRALGRTHSAAEARAAFDIARKAFDRVSFDLIYARAGQKTADWQSELSQALDMAIDHLSLYQLTIEVGTRFWDLAKRGRVLTAPDDRAAEMYEVTQEVTAAAGMPAYEISNHAAPGAESRHNLIYWRYGDYAGIGPGAHGRITSADRSAISTLRDPTAWLAAVARDGHAITETEAIGSDDQADEYLMMALRLREGADVARYASLAGTPLNPARIQTLVASGHLITRDSRLAATAMGCITLDAVLTELLR
ncbi:MAG: radical SAM family heme chaperone HemW [Pseudomonadota bacterium]